MKKCVVIGAGISGMSAAIMLAEHGHNVTLVEKSKSIAPLIRGFDRDGHHFDTGFHYARGLEPHGPLEGWLRALGLALPYGNFPVVHELANTPCGTYALTYSIEKLKQVFPESLSGYEEFNQDARKSQNRSPYMSGNAAHSFSIFPGSSTGLKEYFDALKMNDILKLVLKTRSLLYGVSPDEARLEDFFLVSGGNLQAARTIPGGGKTLAEAYEKRLRELGVKILCGKAVKRIQAEVGFIKEIILEDDIRIVPDITIFTGNPKQLEKMISRCAIKPAWFSHIKDMPSTPEPVILYGLCDRMIPPSHTWYVISNTDGRISHVEEDNPTMAILTGQEDKSGFKPCMIMGLSLRIDKPKTNLLAYALEKMPFLDGHFRQIGAIGGNAMRAFIYGSDGSMYGFAHKIDTMPILPITRLNGFFLAGQNILLPGILGCIVSSAIVCSIINGVEKTLEKFKRCVNEQ